MGVGNVKKVVVITVLFAFIVLTFGIMGCSSPNASTAAPPSGTGSAASAAGSSSGASSDTCPVVTSATSWTGNWASWSYEDICFDARVHFYPVTADNPEPWDHTFAGVEDFPVKFTQTGCDVTGSITVGPNGTLVAPPGCPITLTGKVDNTGAVSGTWHAYCNIEARGAPSSDSTTDSGSFTLNMEPGGSTFVGTFGPAAADAAKYKADNCQGANSNWVGKRA